jgi:hypothetical protein
MSFGFTRKKVWRAGPAGQLDLGHCSSLREKRVGEARQLQA